MLIPPVFTRFFSTLINRKSLEEPEKILRGPLDASITKVDGKDGTIVTWFGINLRDSGQLRNF
jgi:hypothetical protein